MSATPTRVAIFAPHHEAVGSSADGTWTYFAQFAAPVTRGIPPEALYRLQRVDLFNTVAAGDTPVTLPAVTSATCLAAQVAIAQSPWQPYSVDSLSLPNGTDAVVDGKPLTFPYIPDPGSAEARARLASDLDDFLHQAALRLRAVPLAHQRSWLGESLVDVVPLLLVAGRFVRVHPVTVLEDEPFHCELAAAQWLNRDYIQAVERTVEPWGSLIIVARPKADDDDPQQVRLHVAEMPEQVVGYTEPPVEDR